MAHNGRPEAEEKKYAPEVADEPGAVEFKDKDVHPNQPQPRADEIYDDEDEDDDE